MLICDFQFRYPAFEINVKLEMQQQCLAIVGPSGSGKSTFLKNIIGVLSPQEGQIQLGNDILFHQQQQINRPTYQRKIAMIFQNPLLFPHLNVQQNLRYAEKCLDEHQKHFKYDYIVELLELTPLLNRKVQQLSGGEAQRVPIGRALLSSPKLLLLDEPLTGLDQRLKQQILPFLKRIKEEMPIPMLYVSHHQDEIEYLQCEVMEFSKGRLVNS